MQPKYPWILVVAVALWSPLLLLVSSVCGCHGGAAGILPHLSDAANSAVTNAATILPGYAAQVLPPPYSTALQAGSAAVLALLAAWQGFTHRTVSTIKAELPNSVPVKNL